MKSAVWRERGRVLLEDRPVPVARDNEALIQVRYCGLCGSDLEEYLDGPVVARPPRVLGHEIVGVVAQPARDGSGPPTGAVVIVDVVTGCGTCFWCSRGEEGLCPELVVTGQHIDGGLTEYIVATAHRLVVVPGTVPLHAAALAEPLSVAVRVLSKAGPLEAHDVVVVGGGTIGMLVAQLARVRGARRTLVVEPSASRRRLIEGWGIPTVWAATAQERATAVAVVVDPPGAGVVIECSGRPGMVAESLGLTAPGGTLFVLGVLPESEPIDTLSLVIGEKTIRGSAAHMWNTDVREAVELIAAGAVDVASLVSHVIPLQKVPDAFALLAASDSGVIKLLIDCASDSSPESELLDS
jgi:(R,R)-butanediol dehydrogenase/meso-butanediol dehydrogenase/diacetyl reductase